MSKIRVYETICRPRVDKSDDNGSESGSERNTEGVRVGKSGSVKADFLHKCTARINAVLRMCGGLRAAETFFELSLSLSWTWAARPLVLEAAAFLQSLVL